MNTESRLHQLWHGYNKASYPFDELLRLQLGILLITFVQWLGVFLCYMSICFLLSGFRRQCYRQFHELFSTKFPAISSIDLFNLGSFLFPAELYHNLSAETIRSIQLDPTSGESSYVLLYWRGVSLRVVDCRLGGCCMLWKR